MKIFLFWTVIIAIGMTIFAWRFYNKAELYALKYIEECRDHRNTENLMFHYRREAERYEKKYINATLRPTESNAYSQEILEAVKYARIKSHPDNGGPMDDFVKFNECGDRTQFKTGAVRDMHAGKGRMDLLPLSAIIELSKHCENGAMKYGEHNVDKGIPQHSLCDSAMRHLVKYMRGDNDEDHLVAAAWNLMWALNQRVEHPELNDLIWNHPVVMERRFTGLTDKNGCKIFEHDIIKHYNVEDNTEQYVIGIVEWNSKKCRFENFHMDDKTEYILSAECDYEVIGNTFDNPELLHTTK